MEMKPQLIESGQIFLICYQSMEFAESISRSFMTSSKLMRPAKAMEKNIILSLLSPGQTQVCRQFSLSEILSATSNFNDKYVIGCGGYGKVYKCSIENGLITVDVAVKRLRLCSSQGASEFWAEVELLSKLRHCNLVSLIGYCKEGQEMVLVYEYMKHGSLEDQLHRANNSLSWLQRLRICIDAARGLDYLHTRTGSRYGVIHRDVKTSNILLDENFSAKVSDFGLAKLSSINQTHSYVSTTVKGTFGYLDPSYFFTGKLTSKSDVYAFGVVLLEVLCGRPAVDASLEEEKWGLATWAQHCIRKGKESRIVDCRLQGQISPNCLKEFSRIASGCLHEYPKQRPMMAEVVTSLVSLLSLQERMDASSDATLMKKLKSLFWCKDYMKCNYWVLADEAESDSSEASDEAGDTLFMNTLVTGAANDLKVKQEDSLELIHFDASYSSTIVDLLHAPAEYISRNCYSSIYGVTLDDGNQLVVKRIKKTLFRKEFDTEVSIIGKFRHKNITILKAFYATRKEAFLIYACSQNGTVASFLSNSESRRPTKVIDWPTRMKIIIGITRGLVYLHTTKHIIHGNLTSRNVLLDKDYNPLITDIGLPRLRINARPDSPYNHAPELLYFQNASMETDVYSLGLIMLELLTGKSVSKEEWTMEVFDAKVMLEADIEEEFVRILHLALNCMCSSPMARLKADEVLLQLEEINGARKRKDELKRRKERRTKKNKRKAKESNRRN